MNYIYPVFEPIFNAWEGLTTDKKWKELTEYPGDWHHKWLSHERYKINDEFRHTHAKFYEEPTLTDFLWDNNGVSAFSPFLNVFTMSDKLKASLSLVSKCPTVMLVLSMLSESTDSVDPSEAML